MRGPADFGGCRTHRSAGDYPALLRGHRLIGPAVRSANGYRNYDGVPVGINVDAGPAFVQIEKRP